MPTITGRSRLIRAAKDLHKAWLDVQDAWHDGQCAEFDKRVMKPLETNIRVTAQAMERLENLLHQAQANRRRAQEY